MFGYVVSTAVVWGGCNVCYNSSKQIDRYTVAEVVVVVLYSSGSTVVVVVVVVVVIIVYILVIIVYSIVLQ